MFMYYDDFSGVSSDFNFDFPCFQDTIAKWQNKDPVGFQLWKNNNYKKRLSSFKVHSFEIPLYPTFWGSMLEFVDVKRI